MWNHVHTKFGFHSTRELELQQTVRQVVAEAAAQEQEVVIVGYPDRNCVSFGLNGLFDIDEAPLDDVFEPVTVEEYPEIVRDVAADIVLLAEFDGELDLLRPAISIAEYSVNRVEYYERREGETIHNRTFPAQEATVESDVFFNPTGLGSDGLEEELEDVEVDVEEILEELEDLSDETNE